MTPFLEIREIVALPQPIKILYTPGEELVPFASKT